jgi:hypothetical protein
MIKPGGAAIAVPISVFARAFAHDHGKNVLIGQPAKKPGKIQFQNSLIPTVDGASTFLLCRLTGWSSKNCLAVAAAGVAVGGAFGWRQTVVPRKTMMVRAS